MPSAQTIFAFLRRRKSPKTRPPPRPSGVNSDADLTRETSAPALSDASSVAVNDSPRPTTAVSPSSSPSSIASDVEPPPSSWDKLTQEYGPLTSQAPPSTNPTCLLSSSPPESGLSQRSEWSDYSYIAASPPPSSYGSLSPSFVSTPPTSEEGPHAASPAVENTCAPSPTSLPPITSADDSIVSRTTVVYNDDHLPAYRTPITRTGGSFWAEQLESWLYVWDYSWKLSSGEDVTREEMRRAEDINIEVRGLIVSYTMAASALFNYETAIGRLEDLAQLPYYLDEYEGEEVWADDFSVEEETAEDDPDDRSASDYRRGAAWFSIASGSDLSPLFPDEDDVAPPRSLNTAPHLHPWFSAKRTSASSLRQPNLPRNSGDVSPQSVNGLSDEERENPGDGEHEQEQGSYISGRGGDNRPVLTVSPETGEYQYPWKHKGLSVVYNQYTREYYTLHGVIGDGGCARVFYATDDHGRAFALKVSHKMHAFRLPASRQMLRQELRIMGSVASHNCKRLVGIIAGWEDSANINFLMVCRSVHLCIAKLRHPFAAANAR